MHFGGWGSGGMSDVGEDEGDGDAWAEVPDVGIQMPMTDYAAPAAPRASVSGSRPRRPPAPLRT